MKFLNGKGIIDDTMTVIRNNSTPIRAKMLVWLNIVAQKLAVDRPWVFLGNGTATLNPVNNVITMPADYGEIETIRGGTAFFFNNKNLLTPGEAWAMDNAASGLSSPSGYTEGIVEVAGVKYPVITLHGPGYTDPVVVTYTIEPGTIYDTTADTSWPVACRALFMRAMLDFFYEYDMDERAALSYQLNAAELSELKKWDNSRKPKTQQNRHGYRRTR